MTAPAKLNYKIYQGSTFEEAFRWESQTKVYQEIQSISKTAPCVITLQETPTIPVGWRFRVTGVSGMKEVNSVGDNYYLCTDVNEELKTVTINSVNSTQFSNYTTGGILEYNQPVDLTNFSARMQIRKTVDSEEVLHTSTTANQEIIINTQYNTITISIPAAVTQNFNFVTAVYSLELFTPGGVVLPFIAGNMSLVKEVTR